jgi:hypothetical protein
VLLKLTTNAVHVTDEPHRDRGYGVLTQFDDCCPSALTTDRGDQVPACLVAATADLGADAAVLVVARVLLALVGAGAAGHRAPLDRRAEDAEIGLGLPDEDSAGGIAGIGAVEAEANAADQLLYVRLAEVGVGAARARSRAVDALVDTAQKQVAVEGDGARVRLEHFVNRHVTLLSARSGSVRFALDT